MIFFMDGKKVRPGEDESVDETIFPIFNFNNDNYVPSRNELYEVDTND